MIAAIVEGHGEVESVPILLRRLNPAVTVTRPIRMPKHRMLNRPPELERNLSIAAASLGPGTRGGLLVLLDADDDCPAGLARRFGPADRTPAGRDVAVVVATCEVESWFLAAAESLRGLRRLPADLAPPASPEQIRNAKGWLQDWRVDGRAYSETIDQPALAARFDLDLARQRSRSFAKLCREIARLTSG
jgi:hypothetical protein